MADALDIFIRGLGAPGSGEPMGFEPAEAAMFLSGLQKLSMNGAGPKAPKKEEAPTAALVPQATPQELNDAKAQLIEEKELLAEQDHAEAEFLRNQLGAMRSQILEAQQQAELSAQAQEAAGMQADAAEQGRMAVEDQLSTISEQTAMAEQAAAQEAEQKMRLSIRIQQMRQQLADIVSQDPVQEEAMAPGMPTIDTATQQGAAPGPAGAMQQDPTAQGGGPAMDASSGEATPAEKKPEEGSSGDSAPPKKPESKKKDDDKSVEVKVSSEKVAIKLEHKGIHEAAEQLTRHGVPVKHHVSVDKEVLKRLDAAGKGAKVLGIGALAVGGANALMKKRLDRQDERRGEGKYEQ